MVIGVTEIFVGWKSPLVYGNNPIAVPDKASPKNQFADQPRDGST